MLVRSCLKSRMLGFSIIWTKNLQMSKLGLKGRGMRDQIADICWIIEKTREFQKNIYICFTKYTKVFVFSSAQSLSRISLCDSMDCSMPGFPVHHQLLELAQTHVHRVGDAIQPSHPLSSPSTPSFNLSHHQSLFQWVGSLHQVAKVLELQLQHQFFQWIFNVDFF